MLLYSKQGVPFYKLAGASPKEFTGTVSDPENPTLSDALRALLNSMKREATKGLGFSGKDFRPTMEQVVAVARQEKDFVEPPGIIGKNDAPSSPGSTSHDAGGDTSGEGGQPTATPTIRRPRGLRTLCARNAVLMSARPGESEPVAEPGERDKSVTVTDAECDSVTVTEVSRLQSVKSPANSSGDNDLRQRDTGVTVTEAAPSSSSISFSSSSFPEGKEEEKEEETQETTTTRAVTPDIEQAAPEQKPVMPAAEQQALLIWRYAAGLRTSEDAVRYQWNNEPEALAARLARAGIDPGTGRRLKYSAAEPGDDAPRSPQDAPGAPQGIGTGVQAPTGVQASGGIVAAPVTTPPAAGSPTSSRARRRSGLSHAGDILPDGLGADVERDHERDAERDIGSPAPGSPPTSAADDRLQADAPAELLSDADTVRLRNKALRDIAAFSTTMTTSVTATASPAAD
jgi:hypothetical protein